MQDGYMREKDKLGKLAGAAAAVAQEFERTQDERVAVAAQVLFTIIAVQLTSVDAELDKLIEQTGV